MMVWRQCRLQTCDGIILSKENFEKTIERIEYLSLCDVSKEESRVCVKITCLPCPQSSPAVPHVAAQRFSVTMRGREVEEGGGVGVP